MRIGVPREVRRGERRAAATPETVSAIIELGFEVAVEAGLGLGAHIPDAAYAAAGATVLESSATLWAESDIIVKVNAPQELEGGGHEAELLREGGTLISLLFPAQNEALVERLAARKATVLALDCVPRISRAQKMDVLSSMANIAGYRAIIEAAHLYGSFFGGQITAAGKTPPAKVLVIGAGVAGLAAIAAARSLGAVVYAFDTRAACKEQVQSLGGTFLEVEFEESGEGAGGYAKVMSQAFIDAEMALFMEHATTTDIVVTTALIPGKKAPLLWTAEHVAAMRPGSVLVDLAAERGGNIAGSVADEIVERDGVRIIGYTDLTSRLPTHASRFFGTNVRHLLDDLGGGAAFRVDLEDEVIRGATVIHEGEVIWPPPAPAPAPAPAPEAAAPEPVVAAPTASPPRRSKKKSSGHGHAPATEPARLGTTLGVWAIAVVLAGAAVFAPSELIQHLTVFVLAVFIGWQVIWNVSPALHTPLMAVTNAVSGIIIVGGLLQAGSGQVDVATALGAVAIFFASINVFGGFAVTQRMLQMFRK